MKLFILSLLMSLNILSTAQDLRISIGGTAPAFSLMNVNGKKVGFSDYPNAKGFIIVFTCNTCPYSKAYEKRIIDLNNKFSPLQFPLIAINPNDPVGSPGDSFQKMKEHAAAAHFTFPYLYDKDQSVTTIYGAKNTPHVYIVSKKGDTYTVEYIGAIDNDTPNKDPAKVNFAEDAVLALLQDKKPAINFTRAIGCRIVWKKK